MRIVAALGGNALLRRDETLDATVQLRHVTEAVRALAPLADEHELIITHGNGPQIGLLALESAADPALTDPYPLDVLGAETQGMIGYWLARELRTVRPDREIVAILTETLVHPRDPALKHPTKFIGRTYPADAAQALTAARGWDMRPDGPAWRRVVPSPEPYDIVELPTIRRLLAADCIVIAAGGGGVPVVATDPNGATRGVEAVVDKDLTAALLADRIGADTLLLLTDVRCVIRDYGTDKARPIRHATTAEMRKLDLPEGSMGPKVEAACRFTENHPGAVAAIGSLTEARALATGRAGTQITDRA